MSIDANAEWYVVVLLSGEDSEAHSFNSYDEARSCADGWLNQYEPEDIMVMPCYKGVCH